MKYNRIQVDGTGIFYRECGREDAPVLILFHGFPSSSHMFRDLMPKLADHFHCIAPDYPGFGQSESPDRESFAYTFDHIAQIMEDFLDILQIDRFYMYVFDYGAPIGFRIAMRRPEAILGIISQNGNVYEEGLGKKWEARASYWAHPDATQQEAFKSAFAPDTVIGQYTFGTEEGSVAPDGYSLDLYYASQIPDYAEKQSDLIFDYQSNVRLYTAFQAYLRANQPKLLAIWGRHDPSFIWAGAEAFLRDVPDATVIPVESGHFALENRCKEIADAILKWAGVYADDSIDPGKVYDFISERGLRCGAEARYIDLVSEVGELGKELLKGTSYHKNVFKITETTEEELGDCLFSLIALSLELDIDPADALETALAKYRRRLAESGAISSDGAVS